MHGEYDAAIQSYDEVLQDNPKSPDAYTGLTRIYLKQNRVDQAFETVTNGLKVTNAPTVHVALGEVYFRQGKIPEAEQEWVNVINGGYPSARAYWGISRVRNALSLYQQAKEMLDKAHELDSTDPDIQKDWIRSLSRAEQIQFWQNYLSSSTNDDAETRTDMQHHLEFLKALQSQPRHACRMVSHISTTEVKLDRELTDPTHLRGYLIGVSLNGKKGNLAFDTGAGGFLVDEELARKAGITEVSKSDFGGIGDKGRAAGFVGFADSITIGDLEFHDCSVGVIEKRSVVGDDGLIGADVFSSFLVDIDFPNEKLRLKPLPSRPDETNTGVGLDTDSGSGNEDSSTGNVGTSPAAKPSAPVYRGPRDRYIAPEMKSYTQVYRFGNVLLVPTRIGESPPKLFLIDTGASNTMLALNAAREVTKVHGEPDILVKGVSGSVNKVYTVDNPVLQFGHLRQQSLELITVDLSHLSEEVGTELSGILGFPVLHQLEVRIDYRDGIVDFSYNPHP